MNLSIIWFVSTLFLSQVWREMERKKILNRNDFYFSLEAFYDFYYIIIQKYGISPSEGLPPPPPRIMCKYYQHEQFSNPNC